DESLRVAAGARMVLMNGIGAVGGPVVGSALIAGTGPGALFVMMAVAYGTIAGFAFLRVFVRAAAPEPERTEFVPVPAGVGRSGAPLVAELDDLYRPVESVLDVDGRQVAYQVQGPEDADVAVLLGTLPGRDETWTEILPALALDGF